MRAEVVHVVGETGMAVGGNAGIAKIGAVGGTGLMIGMTGAPGQNSAESFSIAAITSPCSSDGVLGPASRTA